MKDEHLWHEPKNLTTQLHLYKNVNVALSSGAAQREFTWPQSGVALRRGDDPETSAT